jgi:hypothetical protein
VDTDLASPEVPSPGVANPEVVNPAAPNQRVVFQARPVRALQPAALKPAAHTVLLVLIDPVTQRRAGVTVPKDAVMVHRAGATRDLAIVHQAEATLPTLVAMAPPHQAAVMGQRVGEATADIRGPHST